MSSFSNILLIDSHVQSYQTFVDSVNANTFPIVFSSSTSKSSILSLMQEHFTKIDRIGIVFEEQPYYMFLDNQPLFTPNEVGDFSENVQFIIEIIKLFNVQNIDYLGCNTLNLPHWTEYYDIIQTNTNAIVGASNDATGNIQYGGNWVMESTGTDIELIYFTSIIRYYKYLLGATARHGFVINSKGVIYGFGNNLCGQLGNDTSSYRQIGNPNSFQQNVLTKMINNTGKTPKLISCGRFHTVVLMTDDTLYSCGQNTYGQLGIGSDVANEEIVSSSLVKMNLSNLGTEKPVSVKCGGYHTVVYTNSRKVYGCGYDAYNQLNNKGVTLTSNTNKGVRVLTNLIAVDVSGIDCGEFHTIYYTGNSIFGFGLNKYGQLGNGNIVDGASAGVTAMVNSPGGTVLQLACGTYRTVVLMTDGSIYSCGYNGDGEFGNGNTTNSNTFTQMTNITGQTPKSIACGERHTIVLMTDHSIYGCGKNEDGQLGIGDVYNYNDQYALTKMTNNTGKNPKSIACGERNTIVLMTDGSVYGCGYNVYVGTGNAIKSNVLTQMSIANIVGINDSSFDLPEQYIRYGVKANDLETFYNTSFIQSMPKPPTTYYYINDDSLNSNINNNILYMHGTRKSCNYLMNGVDIGMNYQFDDFKRAVDLGPYDNELASAVWGKPSDIFANARWLWNTSSFGFNNTYQLPNVYLWFYYTFYSSTAIPININVVSDDIAELYVNQTHIGNISGGYGGQDYVGIEKRSNTVVGLNYIRIAVYNGGGPAGLLVTVRKVQGGTTIANSNSQWAVSETNFYNTKDIVYYDVYGKMVRNVHLVGNMPQYSVANNTYGTTLVSSSATASPPTNAPSWFSICGTSNYVVAVSYGFEDTGRNYVSSDAGNSWSGFRDPNTFRNNHRQAWISRDGKYRLYVYSLAGIALTTDYGANYFTIINFSRQYIGAFVSNNGSVILVSSYDGISKVNVNSSASLTESIITTGDSRVIKGSDDGQYILVTRGSGGMIRSTDYATSFNSTGITATDMAVSFTGEYMIASETGYTLWISSNYGANWTEITATNTRINGLPNTNIFTYTSTINSWGGCTISGTGQYMSVAGFFTDEGAFKHKACLFISSNFGYSWKSQEILSTTTDPFISASTMSYDDNGFPIRIFITTYNKGIFYYSFYDEIFYVEIHELDVFSGSVELVGNMPQYSVANNTYGTTLVSSSAIRPWFSICGTGNYLVAVSYSESGRNYVSGDAGNSWSGYPSNWLNDHRQAWISRDGKYRLYVYRLGGIELTTDYGENYLSYAFSNISEARTLSGAFVSNNGSVMLVSSQDNIYRVSHDGYDILTESIRYGDGDSWRDSRVIKGSDNGQYILVTRDDNVMIRSTDYATSFNSTGITATDMAVSFTGQYMIASNTVYRLWISSNYGANWTEITATNTRINGLPNTNIFTYTSTINSWGGCTISGTGQYMSVAGYLNKLGILRNKAYVFISSDFGVSWTAKFIISTTADPRISTSTMSYDDNGVPIRIFITTLSKGIFYIDF